MKELHKYIIVIFSLFCIIAKIDATTGYVDCDSEGTVLGMEITDCVETPCIVYKPNNYSIGINFIPASHSEILNTRVTAFLDGISIPWPAPSACTMLGDQSCPIEGGQEYNFLMTSPVKAEYPNIDVLVEVALVGDDRVKHACVKFPVSVR